MCIVSTSLVKARWDACKGAICARGRGFCVTCVERTYGSFAYAACSGLIALLDRCSTLWSQDNTRPPVGDSEPASSAHHSPFGIKVEDSDPTVSDKMSGN